MKQSAGFAVMLAVAVAAARFTGGGGTPLPVVVSGSTPPAHRAANKQAAVTEYRGGCTAYERSAEDGAAPKDPNRGSAKAALDSFFHLDPRQETAPQLATATGVRYAIALAPDPPPHQP